MKPTINILWIIVLLLNGGFAVAQNTGNSSDFTSWTVTFKSIKSGQGKTFSGTPNDFTHFKKNFKVNAVGFEMDILAIEMRFNNTTILLRDTLPYAKAEHFFHSHSSLLSDCESYEFTTAQWTDPFYGANNAISSDIDKKNPIEGFGSFFMEGNSANSGRKGFVCSLTRNVRLGEPSTQPVHAGRSGDYTDNLSGEFNHQTDPSKIWFSLYLKGEPNSKAFFRLGVWQKNKGASSSTKNYYFTDIPLNFTEWKQVAIKYSDMQLKMTDSTVVQKLNPEDILSIDYNLYSSDSTAKARVNMDYLMILFAKPKKQ
ncbi:MAG TPA: hypothetical protein VK766_09170 [Cytophagaceae bacterium]|jgi:hypothetical protein|nr:hypothetical protein [Cytophagaceae bacterium]